MTATCPEVIAGPGLAGFELFDRELPPLGRGLIGNRTTYRRGAASIEVAIGPNVVDELEDLDLDSRPTPPSTKSISLFASKAVGAIQVAIWTDADVPTRCQEISVLARGVDEATVLQIVEGLSISPNAEPPADATR